MMRNPIRLPAFVLVDAHVHVHSAFDHDVFLDGAAANFRRGAARVGIDEPYAGCLLLAEMKEARWFRERRNGSRTGRPSGRDDAWVFEPTEEDCSLLARRATGEKLFVIAGRQIVVREGIEVLALGRDAEISDGLPLAATLDHVRAAGALPVLPWGFGKWWLRRGALVAAAFRHRAGEELFLGDNSGRLEMAGMPALFREAWTEGVPVLPGTDPLPLAGHCGRAGSYGCVLAGPLDEARPAACVLRAIRRLKGQPRVYGRPAGLPRFLGDQAAIRLRRHAAGKPMTVASLEPEVSR